MWVKRNAPPRIPLRVKIRGTKEYAGVVELADSLDLGAVTSVKVFLSRCHCEPDRLSGVAIRSLKTGIACFYISWIKRSAPPRIPLRVKIRGTKEYAGMVELVDSVDLGAVTSVKVL